MTTVVISSALANKPFNGGEAWTALSWMLGLRRLGFDTVFVEQIPLSCCRDPSGRSADFRDSANAGYFREVMDDFALSATAALVCEEGKQSQGLSWEHLLEVAAEAALLVNISGHLRLAPLFDRFRKRVYIDHDPGFTQYWLASGMRDVAVEAHDFHFTVGENVGTPIFRIPTGDIRWRPIRQPVLLDQWPLARDEGTPRFTTVASWRGPFGPVEWKGRRFGLKVHEFRKVIDLPSRSALGFEIALDIHPADDEDRRRLLEHGWSLVDPRQVACDPGRFRRYVAGSRAEFSVAQGIYVDTASAWFSDRTVRYLASGRPALVQDTGFSGNYPVGDGLIPFSTFDEAVAGARAIERNYEHHRAAARQVAESLFDSDKVLSRLADEVGICP